MHLIGFLLRATKQEGKSALKSRAEHTVGKRQYTAADGEVQVPWSGVHV